jgi:hypothetical protein
MHFPKAGFLARVTRQTDKIRFALGRVAGWEIIPNSKDLK